MICVSIAESTYSACLKATEGIPMAEIRLDQMALTSGQIKELFNRPLDLIATFRPGEAQAAQRKESLLNAIQSGAAYVDIEFESDVEYRNDIIQEAVENNCRIIISYHNPESTPEKEDLLNIRERCFQLGADIPKIVCQVHSEADCARILSLYETNKPVIAFGMGKLGRITRLAAPFLGAPFTYASLSSGKETAPGQIDYQTLQRLFHDLKHI